MKNKYFLKVNTIYKRKDINMTKTLTNKEFILKANEIHKGKYDYSKVNYKNNHTKVCIICSKHGEFWQQPGSHLIGRGCKECGKEKLSNIKTSNTTEFIKKAKLVHGNKYNYDKVSYIDSQTKVCIICPEHGEFWITPNNHLRGQGCLKCYNKRRNISQKSNTDEFIKKAKTIHGNKYDYSKVDYVNCSTKICIICPEHGEFWQRPDHHLTSKSGCPKCQEKHLEREMAKLLKENNILFERQKTFKWLINPKTKHYQYLDFYLPDYNVAIECQGEQHFEARSFFGGEEEFAKTKERDINKLKTCKNNNIELYYFGSEKYKNLSLNENYFSNKKHLLKQIKGLK